VIAQRRQRSESLRETRKGFRYYRSGEAGPTGKPRVPISVYSLPLLVLLCISNIARAQQPAASEEAPPKGATAQADSTEPRNDRIFGVLPNYRTVEIPKLKIPPLTVGEKFMLTAQDSFDPYAYVPDIKQKILKG
jgi:hypothetical protein